MRVCIISDKPSATDAVLPHILKTHPDMDPAAFVYAQVHPIFHLNPDFSLPRGLSWREYPFSGQPSYRPFRFGHMDMAGEHSLGLRFGGPFESTGGDWPGLLWGMERVGDDPEAEALRRYRTADIVYAVVDPSPSAWLAFDRCLPYLDLPERTDLRIPFILGFDDASIEASFAAPHTPASPLYADMVARGRIRRRFDYGYLANALAVHGRTLRMAGLGPDAPVPSKYGLQTLYDLRANGPDTEGRLTNRMLRWKGTGRYPRTEANRWVGVGSPASRTGIIRMLGAAGLTEIGEDRRTAISDAGRRFLGLLHPDSEDRDLPFRLEAWAELPEPEANARIDRYLRTFFGKQIRYLARSEAVGVDSRQGAATKPWGGRHVADGGPGDRIAR